MNEEYEWLNPESHRFLQKDYLLAGQTVDQRCNIVADCGHEILNSESNIEVGSGPFGLLKSRKAKQEQKKHFGDFKQKFLGYLKKGYFSLSTPIWTNFGTDRGLPISCFGSHIEDSMASILFAHAETGMMSKHGGGTSGYFGKLRGRGEPIRNNGKSYGSVHFMQFFDAMINIVSQGSCYKEGTKVLTDRGFVDFRYVTKNHELAQVDDQGKVSFTKSFELVKNPFKGELYCFGSVDNNDSESELAVTPNHRVVHEFDGIWGIQPAEQFKIGEKVNIPVKGKATGKTDQLTAFDRFVMAALLLNDQRRNAKSVKLKFRTEAMAQHVWGILQEVNLHHDVTTDHVWKFVEIDVSCDFNFIGKKLLDVFRLKDLSASFCKQFEEELSVYKSELREISSDLKYHEVVETIAVLRALGRTGAGEVSSVETKVKTRPYFGMVYCAVVPEGRLIVQKGNQTYVCGNTRRGNFAAYLPIDHPDIEEFLQIRSESSPIQKLSSAVCVYSDWLKEMVDGNQRKREVWAKVLHARNNTGLPYIFFHDNVNRQAPDVYQDQDLTIWQSNLCTEIAQHNNEDESFVCDLMSMNASKYDEWKHTDAVETAIYFLDAVMTEFIRRAAKVEFLWRAVNFAKRQRALGLGLLGYHTYLQQNMIPFESMRAKNFNAEIFQLIEKRAKKASETLASIFGEPELLKGYGRRNATLMAVAPTKSSAFILGRASEGIEPRMTNYFVDDLQKINSEFKNPQLEKLLRERGEDKPETWRQILNSGGSVKNLKCLSDEEKDVFKTFGELSQFEVIAQAAQRQKYIDQGQSINLLIHPLTPPKTVNQLYLKAHELGVKTLYYQYNVNAAQEFTSSLMNCRSCEA